MPFCGSERESSGRERVAESRWSWLASRSWVCVCGGCDCEVARNWAAMMVVAEEGEGTLLYRRRMVRAMAIVIRHRYLALSLCLLG